MTQCQSIQKSVILYSFVADREPNQSKHLITAFSAVHLKKKVNKHLFPGEVKVFWQVYLIT